jgi:AcrR family transcriptional regulator
MERFLDNVQIKINEAIYNKDPLSSELGRQILQEGLKLMYEIGLESFTFKKLASKIGTAESAIYRYFNNKHKLLLYYSNLYWAWIEYSITFSTANIANPEVKLEKALTVLINPEENSKPDYLDIKILVKVIIAESSKAFLTKDVDSENQAGIFSTYKRLCQRLASIILEINKDYPYPITLGSTVLESIISQNFFIEHIPSLSNFSKSNSPQIEFYKSLILKSLK